MRKLTKEENVYHALFVKAAANGDLEKVEAMLQGDNPVDVDCKYNRTTALYVASGRGNVAVVQALLRAGASVNLKCCLEYSVCRGRIRVDETTSLHAACSKCLNVELVEELLKAGADVDMTNTHGKTPLLYLLYSAEKYSPVDERLRQIVRLLLEAKCDVNQKTEQGVTAMYLACDRDLDELVPLLVEYGAIIPPDVLFWCKPAARLDKIVFLLEHGIDVNITDSKGHTALYRAAANGQLDLVRLLLDHHADVSILNRTLKCTALMTAVLKTGRSYDHDLINQHNMGTVEDRNLVVQLLLERITDKLLIDHQGLEGYTALHCAAAVGSIPTIQAILNWGPNLTLRNCEGGTALHSTFSWNESQSTQLEKLKCFFEHTNGYSNADYSTLQDKYGHTALQLVVSYSRHHSLIEYLSSVVDVRVRDVSGDTALHLAVERGLSEQFLDMLLRGHHGRDAANVINNQGRTALMDAVIKANTVAVVALCPVTDINICDNEGKTALHYAVQKKESMYVDVFLKRDANFSIRDDKGNTALALACCLDDYENNLPLSMIFQLYRYGVAYGEQSNMI